VLGGGDDAAAVEVPAVGAGDLEDLAAAGEGHAHGRGEFRAIDVLAGDQVDHAGDRVGAVDGGRAVLHDLGALQDAGRDHVQVEGADLAAGTGRAGTLAVEQDQGAVLTQATQGEGLHASTAFDDEAGELVVDLGGTGRDAGLLQELGGRDLAQGNVGVGRDHLDRDRKS